MDESSKREYDWTIYNKPLPIKNDSSDVVATCYNKHSAEKCLRILRSIKGYRNCFELKKVKIFTKSGKERWPNWEIIYLLKRYSGSRPKFNISIFRGFVMGYFYNFVDRRSNFPYSKL